MLKHLTQASLCALVLAAAPVAHALPGDNLPGDNLPNATFQFTGTAGAYTLNFNVSNDLPSSLNQNIYYFGIEPDVPITNSPNGWNPFDDNNGHIPLGGPSGTVYNTGWITDSPGPNSIAPGASLSGFDATFASIPATVNFYAFVYDTTNTDNKIGYEGIATPAVPEASTTVSLGLLLALGLGGMVIAAKRKKQNA